MTNQHPPATVVALFVRIPLPGRVKTRLAASLGAEEACRFYCAVVADILQGVRGSGTPLYLFHDGSAESQVPAEWRREAQAVFAQRAGDIGERMNDAFLRCFAAGIEKVLLLGSDIPGLDSAVIGQAERMLQEADVVLAPAADGGYCLIGCCKERYRPAIFNEIPWSSAQVLATTVQRGREENLRISLIGTLQDIDTIDDLRDYCRQPAPQALHTNALLKESGYL